MPAGKSRLALITLLCVGAAAWLSERGARAPRVRLAVANPLACDDAIASLRDQAMTLSRQAARLRDEARGLESELAAARASRDVAPAVRRRRLSREHVEACLHGLSSEDLLRFDAMAGRFVASVGLAQPGGAAAPCERVAFAPSFGRVGAGLRRRSVIYKMEKLPPLGLILEESADGRVVVARATASSGVRRGDVLRACSSLARLPRDDGDESFGAQARVLTRCEHQPFDEVLAAVHSNREAPDIPALLVLERPLFSEDVEPPNSCPLREVHRR